MTIESVAVVIVGAGPAGLTAAWALAHDGVRDVLVIEREAQAGGIPRHSDHLGYGLRDLRRFLTGPAYAAKLRARAESAGVRIRTSTMVTHWAGPRDVEVTGPGGRTRIHADAVILATGARERPRTARMVPGDRPAGVLTSGQLQNLVHLHHRYVGRRAVVVGSELVSWSAVLTLREAGCRTVAMTTPYDHPESPPVAAAAARLAFRVPVLTHTSVIHIAGRDRVRAVRVRDHNSGVSRDIECDTVVFTGDWIPDNELARAHSMDLAPVSRAPIVDQSLRTSVEGVFAAGNLVHPVDTADVCALDGVQVGASVVRYLSGERWPRQTVPILIDAPWRWIAPSRISDPGRPPARGRYLLWTDRRLTRPRLIISQGERVIAEHRLRSSATPGYITRIPSTVFRGVDLDAGPVTVTTHVTS